MKVDFNTCAKLNPETNMKQVPTGSRVYLRPGPTPRMPPGLEEVMDGLAREVLRHNPADIYRFCSDHMERLLTIRDGQFKSRRVLSLNEKINVAQKKVKERAIKREIADAAELSKNIHMNNTINSPKGLAQKDEEKSDHIFRDKEEVYKSELDAGSHTINYSTNDVSLETSGNILENLQIQQNKSTLIDNEIDNAIMNDDDDDENKYCNESYSKSKENVNGNIDITLPLQEVDDNEDKLIQRENTDVTDNYSEEISRIEKDNISVQSGIKRSISEAEQNDKNNKFQQLHDTENENQIKNMSDEIITTPIQPNNNVYDDNDNKDISIKDEPTIKKICELDDTIKKTDINFNSSLPNNSTPEDINENYNDNKEIVEIIVNKNPSIQINDSELNISDVGNINEEIENGIIEINENTNNNVSDADAASEKDNSNFVNPSNIDISSHKNLDENDPPEVVDNIIESFPVKDSEIKPTEKNEDTFEERRGDGSEINITNLSSPLIKSIPVISMLENNSHDTGSTILNVYNKEANNSVPNITETDINNLNDSNINNTNTDIEGNNINKYVDNTQNINDKTSENNQEAAVESLESNIEIVNNVSGKSSSIEEDNNDISIETNIEIYGDLNEIDSCTNQVPMDLETAAITIQKVFRTFLFKSRSSTLDDIPNYEDSMDIPLMEENKAEPEEYEITNINKKDRRTLGITRMDTVLQTVNEEKSLSLSTDDSSTLSSAATTIQAHVRGYLVRSKYHSNKTNSSSSLVNSEGQSIASTDLENDVDKKKTILNIHIVPEGSNFESRDESIGMSLDLPYDVSPRSSNLHPLGYDKSERRKQLKREDAIQSVSPPSNNSGKLSEDVESVKDLTLHNNGNTSEIESKSQTDKNGHKEIFSEINKTEHDALLTKSIVIDTDKDSAVEISVSGYEKSKFTNVSSDEMDVVTPYIEECATTLNSKTPSRLLHSGEFHDMVLPTKVIRKESSIVRGE